MSDIIDLEGLRLVTTAKTNVLSGGGLNKHGHKKWQRLSVRELLLKGLGHLTKEGADEECGEHHAVNAATRFDMIAARTLDLEITGAALSPDDALAGAVLLVEYVRHHKQLHEIVEVLHAALVRD